EARLRRGAADVEAEAVVAGELARLVPEARDDRGSGPGVDHVDELEVEPGGGRQGRGGDSADRSGREDGTGDDDGAGGVGGGHCSSIIARPSRAVSPSGTAARRSARREARR